MTDSSGIALIQWTDGETLTASSLADVGHRVTMSRVLGRGVQPTCETCGVIRDFDRIEVARYKHLEDRILRVAAALGARPSLECLNRQRAPIGLPQLDSSLIERRLREHQEYVKAGEAVFKPRLVPRGPFPNSTSDVETTADGAIRIVPATESHEAVCANCTHWDHSVSSDSPYAEAITGACRRRSPSTDSRTGLAVWPFTAEDDHCSEFEGAEG